MSNPNAILNLNPNRQFKPKWNHKTTAIRIPEPFADQLMQIARAMDEGKWQQQDDFEPAPRIRLGVSYMESEHWSGEDFYSEDEYKPDKPVKGADKLNFVSVFGWLQTQDIQILKKVETAVAKIVDAKERACDRRLEQCLLYLHQRCDGAEFQDGSGFNGCDTRFGKWLGSQVENKHPILLHHAKAAFGMLQKYRRQLERGGLSLPDEWANVAHQYPEKWEPKTTEELPEKRIEVHGSEIAVYAPYDATGRFQREAKSIEDYRFCGSDKSWRYPIDKIEQVTAKYSAGDYFYDPNLEGAIALFEKEKAEEIARLEAEALEKSGNIIKLVNNASLSEPLANGWHLRNYQQQGVEWLLAHTKGGIYSGGILADQMGLGKTLTALIAAKTLRKSLNCSVWVVCPVSLKQNWLKEAAIAEVAIEVFSWSKLPKATESKNYLLIADEAHYAQNFKSQRTQKLIELAQNQNCLAAWLLTGTPLKNGRPINLFPLLLAVGHSLAENKGKYERHYCNAGYRSIGKKSVWDASGSSHLDELAAKTEDVILQRIKQECLAELPAKSRIFKQVELESSVSKEYHGEIAQAVQDYRDRVKLGLVDEGAEALVTLNILRKTGSKYKVAAVIEMAQELLEQNQQVVIFTEFLESAKAIHAELGGELLTGETKPDERQALVDRFQSGESKVFVGTIKAGGVGLTLTAASNVILVDRPWTPGDTEQAEDRCHRLGQQNAVFAIWMQLGIIDEKIDILLQSKAEKIEMVLKGKTKTLKGLDSPKELAKQLLELL